MNLGESEKEVVSPPFSLLNFSPLPLCFSLELSSSYKYKVASTLVLSLTFAQSSSPHSSFIV